MPTTTEGADLTTEATEALASSGLLSFYDRLRQRVAAALERRGGRLGRATADVLLLAPDLLILLARLGLDRSVPPKSRRLILVTGIPGSGKTLVGLRTVHAHFLDDLAVEREDGRPTVPAVFLSGNGPLVQVLQYELKGAGGGGKAFVRGVKDYVKRYSAKSDRVPGPVTGKLS